MRVSRSSNGLMRTDVGAKNQADQLGREQQRLEERAEKERQVWIWSESPALKWRESQLRKSALVPLSVSRSHALTSD